MQNIPLTLGTSALFLVLLNSGCQSPTLITIGNCNQAANGGNAPAPNGSQPVGCNVTISANSAPVIGLPKKASLQNAAGEKVGTAVLIEANDGVVVAADLHGLSSGKYSVSLHSVGGCDLALPSNRKRQLPVEIDGSKGFGTTITGATLDGTNGLLGTNGGTVVVEDNTGGRVACGVFK